MNKISKGKALALFVAVTIIAFVVLFSFIIYGNPYTNTSFNIGVLLCGIIMMLNLAWLVVWKIKYDKNNLIEQQHKDITTDVSNKQENEDFAVFVDDNYHFMDTSYRYQAGVFDTREDAIAKCCEIVEKSIGTNYKKGTTAEELYSGWSMYGESPFIIPLSTTSKAVYFSASEYAKYFCEQLSEKL